MHLQRGHRDTRLQRENRQEKNRRRDDSRERESMLKESESQRERDRERAREREIHRMQTLPDTLRLCFSTCFFATLLPPTMQRLSFRKVLFLSTANAEASKRKWCHKILAIWS